MKLSVFLAPALVLLTASCGYHTAGHNTQLPPDIKTIAIPGFVNVTKTYRIEQIFTAAVVQEWLTRTNYRVVNNDGEGADATLRGTIVSTSSVPSTYDSRTGRAASVAVAVFARVTLTARDGKVLYDNPSYVFKDQYQLSNDLSTFFEEDTPSLQRMSRDFARTLVSNILEGF